VQFTLGMKRTLGLAFAIAAASLLAAPGCVIGEDGVLTEPTEDDLPPAMSEAALSNNARTAFNFFVSKGLTEIQAAGIVGNLMQESSVRPTAVEYSGGPGRGIAQWSVGGRWNTDPSNVTKFAAARGANRWGLATQLDFIWHELTVVGGFGITELRAASTLSQAVIVFQNRYERCGTCAQGKRMEYAQQALTQFGGGADEPTPPDDGTGTGTGTGGGEPDAGATCYSGTLGRDMPENACVQSMYDGEWYQCSGGAWVDRWSDPDACVAQYPL